MMFDRRRWRQYRELKELGLPRPTFEPTPDDLARQSMGGDSGFGEWNWHLRW